MNRRFNEMLTILNPIFEYQESHPSDTYGRGGSTLTLYENRLLELKDYKAALIQINDALLEELRYYYDKWDGVDYWNRRKLALQPCPTKDLPLVDGYYLHIRQDTRSDPCASGYSIFVDKDPEQFDYEDIAWVFMELDEFITFIRKLFKGY